MQYTLTIELDLPIQQIRTQLSRCVFPCMLQITLLYHHTDNLSTISPFPTFSIVPHPRVVEVIFDLVPPTCSSAPQALAFVICILPPSPSPFKSWGRKETVGKGKRTRWFIHLGGQKIPHCTESNSHVPFHWVDRIQRDQETKWFKTSCFYHVSVSVEKNVYTCIYDFFF